MHVLFFIIDAYVTSFLTKYTLKRIFDTLNEESWETDNNASLHIYFLCPNNQIIIYMRKILTQSMNSYYCQIPLSIYFATRNQFYAKKEGKTEKVGWKIISS